MTVSLTLTESSTNSDPLPATAPSHHNSPDEMTSTVTTADASPRPTSVGSAPNSPFDKEDETAESGKVCSIVSESSKPSTGAEQDEETEEETSTEYAGDDDPGSHVINTHSESSDSTVQVANKRARDCDIECNDPTTRHSQSTTESGRKRSKKEPVRVVASPINDANDSIQEQLSSGELDNEEAASTQDVAEMARLRAAKFIQERTKMACLLPTGAEVMEAAKTACHTNSSSVTPVSSGHQGSNRKRKLTVKDILVSQRTRNESSAKQARNTLGEAANSTSNPTVGLGHMFSGLGQMLEPGVSDANPLAALLAAAAAASSGANGVPPTSSAGLGASPFADSQSAYISTLASSLSSTPNPTATLALMASLSAMMQNSTAKEGNDIANNSLDQLTNPLVNLESTLSNFGQSVSGVSTNNDDGDEEEIKRENAPLDFSIKSPTKEDERSCIKRKSRKKCSGQDNEEEFPLDLSLSTKRPEELSKSDAASISSMLAEGANGGNFAAMAAAAAFASFSPNILTRMAASMNPWSNYGLQGLKFGNDPANAFSALFQQVNQTGHATSANKSSASPASLMQSFPDLYWNGGKLASGKSPTASPSFGPLTNSSVSLSARHHHHAPPPSASQPMRTKSSSGRQNPWQAQWINRSSEQTRDVFTCVWCKESFKSLAEMTDHMKRSPRCGMAGMQQHHSHHHHSGPPSTSHSPSQHAPPAPTPPAIPVPSKSSLNSPSSKELPNQSTSVNSNPLGSGKSPSGVNMPRKLVRGQDVWLGRGAEQTRQILKCMWCGQSFKSLADMTQHMKITQHYTNIISQEQIISWRTPEEKMGQSQVNAVLTCKVCDEAFGSLKELSNHMIKNSHFKESTHEPSSGSATRSSDSIPTPSSVSGNGVCANASSSSRNSRSNSNAVSSDRRKKSLPVRKLLEMERGEIRRVGEDEDESEESGKSISSQLIECDDCHERIEPRCFLQHIKQCRLRNTKSGGEPGEPGAKDGGNKSDHGERSSGANSENQSESTKRDQKDSSKEEETTSQEHKSSEQDQKLEEGEKKVSLDSGDSVNGREEEPSSSSVLSALEKLIEKNFDSKSRRSQQTGILQRLGIDEEVFPPWQNMAPSPMAAMSPSVVQWPALNGLEFSRSNSSSSSNSRNNRENSTVFPQHRYRRNSSNSLKDKLFAGLGSAKTTESNGSFSSQETEEEESCDESNSDYGGSRSHKKSSSSRNSLDKARLNFPISSMLSSPIHPARPTSASSTASSVSPSELVAPQTVVERLNNMTPNSHRSNGETDDDNELGSPIALCKKFTPETKRSNGMHDDETDDETGAENGGSSHHPLMQLQKLLDKTDHSARSSSKSISNSHRMSPFSSWTDSGSIKAVSPASSPRTTPIAAQHSPASARSEQEASPYMFLKCAFCGSQVGSHMAYRSHLAKVHLAMRDSMDISAISDEELLLLVLAKNSNIPFASNHLLGPMNQKNASNKPPAKESKRKSKSDDTPWNKSPTSNSHKSPPPQIESSQSKFLKYSELAKQLSSKYA